MEATEKLEEVMKAVADVVLSMMEKEDPLDEEMLEELEELEEVGEVMARLIKNSDMFRVNNAKLRETVTEKKSKIQGLELRQETEVAEGMFHLRGDLGLEKWKVGKLEKELKSRPRGRQVEGYPVDMTFEQEPDYRKKRWQQVALRGENKNAQTEEMMGSGEVEKRGERKDEKRGERGTKVEEEDVMM